MVVLLLHTDFRGDGATLTISAGHAGGVFDVALNFEDIAWVLNRGKMSIAGPLRAEGELNLGRPAAVDLQLAMARPRIDVAGKAAAADNLSIGFQEHLADGQPDGRHRSSPDPGQAAGRPRGRGRRPRQPDRGITGNMAAGQNVCFGLPDMALDVPGLASLEGSLNLDRGGEPAFEAGAKARLPDLESLARAAAPFLPEALRGVSLRGKADLEAKYARSQAPESGPGTISARLEARAVEWTAKGGGLPLSGRLSGTIQAEGSPADPRLSGDIRLESGKLSGMGAGRPQGLGSSPAHGDSAGLKDRRPGGDARAACPSPFPAGRPSPSRRSASPESSACRPAKAPRLTPISKHASPAWRPSGSPGASASRPSA